MSVPAASLGDQVGGRPQPVVEDLQPKKKRQRKPVDLKQFGVEHIEASEKAKAKTTYVVMRVGPEGTHKIVATCAASGETAASKAVADKFGEDTYITIAASSWHKHTWKKHVEEQLKLA